MGTSLLVYTKESERYPSDDITFTLDGKGYVFSPRKDNRLMFMDSATAQGLMQAYQGTFTLWANYEGDTFNQPTGNTTIDNVAMVMVNHRTYGATKNAYNSFREFYPTVKAYIVDNGSNDLSVELVKSFEGDHTTVILNPYNYGHGPAIHQVAAIAAARGYKFLLTLDSDTLMHDGGMIEAMLAILWDGYAIGKLYLTDEHGFVNNSERGVRYIHPAAAMINLRQYMLLSPFALHGAPCIHNMIDAQLRKLRVFDFPIEDYLRHFGTVTVLAVKMTDVNAAYLFAQRPPLVSFVVLYQDGDKLGDCIQSILCQSDTDYEIVPITSLGMLADQRSVIIRVRGLYIYIIDASSALIDADLVAQVREVARQNLNPNVIIVRATCNANVSPGDDKWGRNIESLEYKHLIERRELWMSCTIDFSGQWDRRETIENSFARKDWPSVYWLDRIAVQTNG